MVRFATSEDLEQINIIRKEVNDLHVKGNPKIFKKGFSKEIAEYVNQYVNREDKFLLICEENNLICSYAMVNIVVKPETPYRYELKYLEIHEIGTLQSQQGKGYGKQLIQKVKDIAKEHAINRIELNMWAFNESALTFYEKLGFNTYRRYLEMFC